MISSLGLLTLMLLSSNAGGDHNHQHVNVQIDTSLIASQTDSGQWWILLPLALALGWGLYRAFSRRDK